MTGVDKAVNFVNIPKHIGKAIGRGSENLNNKEHRVLGTTVGVVADIFGAAGEGVTAVATTINPEAAIPAAGTTLVRNIGQRVHTIDNVIDKLHKEKNGELNYGDRETLKIKFEMFKSIFEETPKTGNGLTRLAKGMGEMVIGRNDIDSKALKPFTEFTHANGSAIEFRGFKDAANTIFDKKGHAVSEVEFKKMEGKAEAAGKSFDYNSVTSYGVPPKLADYIVYKQALKENPALEKREDKFPVKDALAHGATLPEYTEHLKDNTLGKYKAEIQKQNHETDKELAKDRAELAKEAKQEGKKTAEVAAPEGDIGKAVAQAASVKTDRIAMKSDATAPGVPEGNLNLGMATPQSAKSAAMIPG